MRLLLIATAVLLASTVAAGERPIESQAKRRAVRSGPTPPSQTQTVVLAPSKDNTLYESADGSLSNGAGPNLFAGTTRFFQRRRAVIAFDVASQIPPGSRITSVTLTMHVSMTISGAEPATLHRLTADWGEGTSDAGPSHDGGGALSRSGDATWLHRFFPDQPWSAPGGDFDAAADATASVNKRHRALERRRDDRARAAMARSAVDQFRLDRDRQRASQQLCQTLRRPRVRSHERTAVTHHRIPALTQFGSV